MIQFIIYTDWSCIGNPWPGGWAYVLLDWNRVIHQDSWAISQTTNNQMELYACIQALTYMIAHYPHQACILYTDSRYVQTWLEYLPRRQTQWWKTSARKPVKNQSLRLILSDLAAQYQIDRRRVQAHHISVHNNQVDLMARQQAVYAQCHPQLTLCLPDEYQSMSIQPAGLFDI